MLGPTTARLGMLAAVLGVIASIVCLNAIWSTPATMDTSQVTALSALTERVERAQADLGKLRARADRAVRGLDTGATSPAIELLRRDLIPTLAEIRADVLASEIALGLASSRTRGIELPTSLLRGEPARDLGIDPALPIDAQIAQVSSLIADTSTRVSVLEGAATTVTTETQIGMSRTAIGSIGGRAVTTALAILALTISASLGVVAYTESPNRGLLRARVRHVLGLAWIHDLDLRRRAADTAIAWAHVAAVARRWGSAAWDWSGTTASAGKVRMSATATRIAEYGPARRAEETADGLLFRTDAVARRIRHADVPGRIVRVLSAVWSEVTALPGQVRDGFETARARVSEFSLRSE